MKIKLTAFSCFLFITTHAQDVVQEMKRLGHKKPVSVDSSGWRKYGHAIFEVNQASFTNWAVGGEKFMLGLNSILDYSAHHQFGKYSMDTYIDVELGFVEAASFNRLRKTNDRCDLTFEFEHTMGRKTYYGFLTNFNTQFFPGYNYFSPAQEKNSSFLSPGKLLFSPGFDFKDYNRQHYLSIFISPVTFRWVIKKDEDFFNKNAFGVDSANKVLTEIGPYLTIHLNEKFSKSVEYTGRLDLFTDYKRHTGNIDFLIHNLLKVAIAKKFSANFLIDIIYDHDIRQKIQIQQVFGLGLKLPL